jgi:2-keto-3-deoxy-L-rhamnonate aldolase RhmA
MNRLQTFKQKLKNQDDVLGTAIVNLKWSGVIQRIASLPFDFVLFDTEHGTLNAESIEEMLRVCRLVDLPSIVRVPDVVPHLISKTIDMGADGLLFPRVESAEQVGCAISAMRFSPRGKKGCGGFSLFRSGEAFDSVNDDRLAFIQIESDDGINALPEILKLYRKELSGVIIGPYDMSIIAGKPLDIKCGEMMERYAKVFKICAAEGLAHGIFIDAAANIPDWKKLGVNIFWVGTELSLLMDSYRDLCGKFAGAAK